jgi:hypothetical protein
MEKMTKVSRMLVDVAIGERWVWEIWHNPDFTPETSINDDNYVTTGIYTEYGNTNNYYRYITDSIIPLFKEALKRDDYEIMF